MFLTFRRHHLDRMLLCHKWHSKVLDIGGKKANKRGRFRPPRDSVESWEYVNIDPATKPDYLCSADAIPVACETFDMVLMTEVLEHLEKPMEALAEAHRILKRGGRIVITMPFLYGVHADPQDFQRWTAEKIRREFENIGFAVECLEPMGGLFAVIYDLLYLSLGVASKKRDAIKNRVFRRLFMPIIRRIFFFLDDRFAYKMRWITTGWFVLGKKNQCITH